MCRLHYIKEEESAEKESCEGKPMPDMEFWRTLVEKPGCIGNGICNNCGLCEH